MTGDLVSCVIPVYNGARFVGETLDSVFAQTHNPIEVIVIDDGSTDETPHVVQRYGSRLKYLRQRNQGAAAARNKGIEAASGAYICMLDSDDIWHPEAVARLLAELEDDSSKSWVVGKSLAIFSEELKEYAAQVANTPLTEIQFYYQLGAVLFRRDVFDRVGVIDEKLVMGEDIDLLLRIEQEFGPAGELDALVLLHRLHRSSLTANLERFARGDLIDVVHRHRKRRQGAGQI